MSGLKLKRAFGPKPLRHPANCTSIAYCCSITSSEQRDGFLKDFVCGFIKSRLGHNYIFVNIVFSSIPSYQIVVLFVRSKLEP